jgi:hypothetical protein
MTATALGSGLSVGDVRTSRPQSLIAVSRRLEEQRRRVVSLSQLLLWGRSAAPRWSGAASAAAADRYGVVAAGLGQIAQSIGVAGQALGHAAGRLQSAIDLVGRADRRASAEGAWIDHDGTLFMPVRTALGDPAAEAYQAHLDELLRTEVHACLLQARRAATETDEGLARALLASARGTTGSSVAVAPGMPVPTPPSVRSGDGNAAVFASAAWWRSLTDGERRRVLRERPEWVGPRDGIPAAARHEANLILLARAERTAAARIRELAATPHDVFEIARVQAQVGDLRAIRDVLGRRDGNERRLLLVDTGERDVKAVVALGDVDRAEHLTTFVGGLSTTVHGDLARYDTTFASMRADAKAVARGDVAVVTWMGYDAPQLDEVVGPADRSVLNAKLARDNAGALADFVTGLEAARDGRAHQTVWAHSYGGLLAGFASLRTSGIDDVAVFGAPGLPFSDVDQTSLKPGSLNVLGAIGDDVFDYGWVVHGNSPATVVGAVRLSTFAAKEPGVGCNHWLRPRSDFVDVGRTSTGHSDYLRAGTDSAHNLVAVAAGRPDLRIVQGADERACTTTGPSFGVDPLTVPRPLP